MYGVSRIARWETVQQLNVNAPRDSTYRQVKDRQDAEHLVPIIPFQILTCGVSRTVLLATALLVYVSVRTFRHCL
uniref:Uncharacterized protein n=1 Tax=Arion vulgaris TaxID=1028688 RepID=A0A0B7A4T9_9EUPU